MKRFEYRRNSATRSRRRKITNKR